MEERLDKEVLSFLLDKEESSSHDFASSTYS